LICLKDANSLMDDLAMGIGGEREEEEE
jgi:hypothetical protein